MLREIKLGAPRWEASKLNDLGGNFRLTFAKKSGVAKISQFLFMPVVGVSRALSDSPQG